MNIFTRSRARSALICNNYVLNLSAAAAAAAAAATAAAAAAAAAAPLSTHQLLHTSCEGSGREVNTIK